MPTPAHDSPKHRLVSADRLLVIETREENSPRPFSGVWSAHGGWWRAVTTRSVGRTRACPPLGVQSFWCPRTSTDGGLGAGSDAVGALDPSVNPDLSRRVYSSAEGTIDLVPGPSVIGWVVAVAGTGEWMSGTTSTALAARGAVGVTSSGSGSSVTFRGVLSAGVQNLRVVTADGNSVPVAVNADAAYWVTVADPVDAILTMADGTERPVPFARPGPTERPNGTP